MNHRNGCVAASTFADQQKCQRLSYDHAATKNDNVRAGDFDPAFDEQTLTAKWRARHESTVIAERELGHIHRVEAINVLSWIECTDDGSFIDLFWRWRLHKDSVDL